MDDRKRILSSIKMNHARHKPLFTSRNKQELFIQWRNIQNQRAQHEEELVKSFTRECELLSGTVYTAQDHDALRQVLSSIMNQANIQRTITWHTPLLEQLGIDQLLNSLGVHNMVSAEKASPRAVRQSDHMDAAAEAELGISGVDYALADTGALVLRTSPQRNRSASLLPPIHVAIMESSCILFNSDQLTDRLLLDLEEKGDLDSCLTIITGPSVTADIELNLALGVHGPKELHVIILKSN